MSMSSNIKKKWDIDPSDAGRSVRDFLRGKGRFSRQLLKRVRMNGHIFIDEKEAEMWQPLKGASTLTILFPAEERGAIEPVEGPLAILYEDEDILVLDKPSGIAVVPPYKKEPSIASHLIAYYEEIGHPCTVHIVTRLDTYTSGLMLVAKHAYSHMLLTRKAKLVDRFYQALVEGLPEPEKGLIDAPIERADDSIIRRTVDPEGKPSQTMYDVLETGGKVSKVAFQLLTGRTHQIRVHMAHIGHPLVGDTLYGARQADKLAGQALHCYHLKLQHPWTGESMSFDSKAPSIWSSYMKEK
ncbi:ribosomal large subunit pseudouridine synthase, RluA family [Halobacillus sp. BAB-2008]|nr:ribosomal large subunit pseudouridine synthase, RluA family [Halobacillus sp. BAB-2008]